MRAALATLVVLAACGSGAAPSRPRELPTSPAGVPRETIEKELSTILMLSDRTCACTDEACFAAADADLRAYIEVATINDPVTEVETWPSDLDQMARLGMVRILACMGDHGYAPAGFGVFELRRVTALRDAGCACTDGPCAKQVWSAWNRLREASASSLFPVDDETRERTRAPTAELVECLREPLAAQMLDDLVALRKAACACADQACADKVQADFAVWARENQHTVIDHETSARLTAVAEEVGSCLLAAQPSD